MITPHPVTDDRPVLGSIVGDADRFVRCVFGQGPWRGHSGCAEWLFGVDDVDRIVTSAVRTPAIRMVRNGNRVPPERYCTPTRIGSTTLNDVADVRKVLDQIRHGATLVLQSLHRTWSPVSAWCASLEREIGWPVQANAYLTPPGERGLAPHADGHDVMAIQLHGSKGWHVDGLGDVDLEVGDVLYLPAGQIHRAETGARPSLHLTVGIHRPTAERIARAAATKAIERADPPIGTTTEASVGLLRDALGDLDTDELVEELRRPPRVHAAGLLATSVTRAELTGGTSIVRSGPWSVERCDGRVVLRWENGQLWLPEHTAVALTALAEHSEPTPVEVLPGLRPDERMILARRLLDEGAATTTA